MDLRSMTASLKDNRQVATITCDDNVIFICTKVIILIGTYTYDGKMI